MELLTFGAIISNDQKVACSCIQ